VSTPEQTVRQETEGRSSVTLTLNASRKTQITVKRYVDEEPGALEAASAEAQRIYDTLVQRYMA